MATEPTNPQNESLPPAAPQDAAGAGAFALGAEALREYGQVLGETVRAKSVELSQRGNRRRLLPLLLAVLAGVIAARDLVFSTTLPAIASAARHTPGVIPSGQDLPVGETRSPIQKWLDQPFSPITRNIFTAAPANNAAQDAAAALEPKSVEDSSDGIQQRETPRLAPMSEGEQLVATRPATQPRPVPARSDREQARQIRLQSTLMGVRPTALVNGRTVREGDIVAFGSGDSRTTFRVLTIEARGITLEREGIRLEIPME